MRSASWQSGCPPALKGMEFVGTSHTSGFRCGEKNRLAMRVQVPVFGLVLGLAALVDVGLTILPARGGRVLLSHR